jgi:uncharacterized low-complexity protein
MADKKVIKPVALAVGAALAGSFAISGAVNAADTAESPFSISNLEVGYMLGEGEGKCGEGKCGDDKKGEGKCGEEKEGEGKCGEEKEGEGKCGEGSCGEEKEGEGKCGEGSCGGSA